MVRFALPMRVWQFEQNCGSWQREHCWGFVEAVIGWTDSQSLRWLSGFMSRLNWLLESFRVDPPALVAILAISLAVALGAKGVGPRGHYPVLLVPAAAVVRLDP
jgi:hypothetical protein